MPLQESDYRRLLERVDATTNLPYFPTGPLKNIADDLLQNGSPADVAVAREAKAFLDDTPPRFQVASWVLRTRLTTALGIPAGTSPPPPPPPASSGQGGRRKTQRRRR